MSVNRNKTIACGCQGSAVGCLIENKKYKSKKGHNSEEKNILIVWIALWILNTYSEFQVNIFSNKRDITICQFFGKMTKTTTTMTPRL